MPRLRCPACGSLDEGRPIDDDGAAELAAAVEDEVRLEALRGADAVAAIRFASVYKGFEDVADFEREVTLLAKLTEPKRR